MKEKQDIRNRVKARKSLLTELERRMAAAQVFDVVERSAAFLMSDRILMYHSLPDELSTIEFINKWSDRKQFFLPRVNGVNLELLPYNRSQLRLGAFHIEEPEGSDITPPELMELIIVPAVAFDRHGNRIGRGKGFYDRLLAETKATTVGVGYDFQLFDEVPTEPHDTPLDMVITQTTHIVVRHKK